MEGFGDEDDEVFGVVNRGEWPLERGERLSKLERKERALLEVCENRRVSPMSQRGLKV